MRATYQSGLLSITLLLTGTASVEAQRETGPLPNWEAEAPDRPRVPNPSFGTGSEARSQTGKGLLIGGLIGAAATTLFLIGFCSDADTKCEMDEVGRAVLVIAVPAAALGALIGSLVRTNEEDS
ncbi:MAG TPA: hypothetical protein VFH24_06720 [Gemmatimonadales bacterium]|nr:hypothetical protein [Gemmatimonadales bacterium]